MAAGPDIGRTAMRRGGREARKQFGANRRRKGGQIRRPVINYLN